MTDSLRNRRFEVAKIDRLGEEIKGAAVHRGADVDHVAISRDDDGRQLYLVLLQLLEEREPVHPRHVDVGNHQIDVLVGRQRSQGFDTVVREQKADGPIANLVPELLLDKRLQVRLVVDNQDSCGHVVRSTRLSISLRSSAKSIGLVRSASAPRSSAWRLVSASP